MVNLEWLRYFVALAEIRNFAATADHLHITPQAMSHAIAGLEAHFGVKLVERAQRMKGLTPAGDVLLGRARRILSEVGETDHLMAEWQADAPQGALRLASLSLMANYWLPEVLGRLAGNHPRLRPQISSLRAAEAERLVAAGELDAAIVEGRIRHPDLKGRVITESRYVIVGRPQPSRSWHDLGFIVPLVGRSDPTGEAACASEQEVAAKWNDERYTRRIVAEVDLLDTAIRLAEAGVGVAYLPTIAVEERLQRGTLAVVADAPEPYTESYSIGWAKHGPAHPGIRALLASMDEARPA